MRGQILVSIFLVLSLSGCSHLMTAQEPSSANVLRINLAKMEKKLESNDQEISSLKQEISTLENRLRDLESYDIAAATVNYDSSLENNAAEDDSRSSYDNIEIPSKYSDIIRVNAPVTDIQRALKNAGYYNGTIDGKFGARSKSAVYSFQKDHNLNSDGIIGRQTWSELKSYLN